MYIVYYYYYSYNWLLSGSLDASVKLWAVISPNNNNNSKQTNNNSTTASSNSNSSNTTNNTSNTNAIIHSKPIVELFDCDSAVLCVSMDEHGRLGAAGTVDGLVYIWDLKTRNLIHSFPASVVRR